MTYPAHVLAGALIYRACGPAVGLPLAVASHFVLDGTCRYHPMGMEWPWRSMLAGRVSIAAVARANWRVFRAAPFESKMLWCVNVASTLAILAMWVTHRVGAGELWLGGVLAGWLSHDAFHVIRDLWPGSPLLRLDPHRLTDWMRARWWPRNGEEPWGAWMEAGLIVALSIVAVFA